MIEPRQAAQVEAARLKALAPGTYRHPDGSPPERQDFEAFSRQYDQMANERHVWRFARPDGSTYETSWRGLGTATTAQASASLLGHRVIGEVIPGPAVEGPPARDPGGTRREPQLTRPPLVQAEPPYSPPPLVQAERPFTPPPLVPAGPPYTPPPLIQAEPPFDPLPWPQGNRVDDSQRGIANKLGAPTRSAKKSAGGRSVSRSAVPSLSTGTWSARLSEPLQDEIIAANPKDAGILADPAIPRASGDGLLGRIQGREGLLAMLYPDFAYWLLNVLQPTVGNFLINLRLEKNDVSQLEAAGIISPGQNPKDRGSVLENGSQKNAFRHTFGQALITKAYGRKLAVASGFAHEDLPTIDTTRRYFSNPSVPSNALFEADTVADQLNNEIGRQIAESLGPTVSNRDVAAAVLSEFKDKGLYVATFEVPGVVKISRQRLTQQQFNQIMTLLNSLKQDGKVH